MNRLSSSLKPFIFFLNKQPCVDESKKNPNAVCTLEYKPVVGCNNKVYSNECFAKNAGLTSWKLCIDPEKINPKPKCTKILKPVKGCDDKIYNNECLAKAAGLTQWTLVQNENKNENKKKPGCGCGK